MACPFFSLCVETQLGESGQGANLPSVILIFSTPAHAVLVRMAAITNPPKGPFFIYTVFAPVLIQFSIRKWGLSSSLMHLYMGKKGALPEMGVRRTRKPINSLGKPLQWDSRVTAKGFGDILLCNAQEVENMR